MTQFDVFANPITNARSAYPFVVNLQSDATSGSGSTMVAPLALATRISGAAGRLTPKVTIDQREYFVATGEMTPLATKDLSKRVANFASYRSKLLDGIDLLFFGV
jgi:hypothetical protein